MGEVSSEIEIAFRLAERSETLAVVETSAGGLVCSRLSAVPGSSAWFLGGVVAYSAVARLRWLGMNDEATRAAGVVSAETALALARAARDNAGAVWGAAETGIAGPQTGRRSSKPVGLAYVAVVGSPQSGGVETVEEVVTGSGERGANRESFAEALLRLLVDTIGRS